MREIVADDVLSAGKGSRRQHDVVRCFLKKLNPSRGGGGKLRVSCRQPGCRNKATRLFCFGAFWQLCTKGGEAGKIGTGDVNSGHSINTKQSEIQEESV